MQTLRVEAFSRESEDIAQAYDEFKHHSCPENSDTPSSVLMNFDWDLFELNGSLDTSLERQQSQPKVPFSLRLSQALKGLKHMSEVKIIQDYKDDDINDKESENKKVLGSLRNKQQAVEKTPHFSKAKTQLVKEDSQLSSLDSVEKQSALSMVLDAPSDKP